VTQAALKLVMDADTAVAVEGLTVRYGERVALHGVSFSVRRGEVFGFLGPNGAGKSTLFSVLAGLQKPAQGRVSLPAPGRVGVVFQSPSLDGLLTARENMFLAAALYGVPRPERRARVEALLELAGLQDRGGEPVKGFSEGMRRRLEIVRALVHGPELLVLDEPTSGLDEAAFRRTWEHLLSLRAEGVTLVVATHRADEAEKCDRLAVLDLGRLVALAAPAELKARVGGDVVVVEADAPGELAAEVRTRFGLAEEHVIVLEREVHIEVPRGHELLPRLVEAFPRGRLRSLRLQPPTLADAFVHLTGKGFEP
jgi:ABC-2 type transport system ATP-binding protein